MFIEQPPLILRWLYPRAFWRMDKNEKAVYLTFDDGPLSLSLAATNKIDVSFSSSGYLDVSVHRVTSCMAIYSPYGTYTLLYVGSPIRTSADQRLFAPPRSLSQLVTSFFGSCCQGIRLMLLLA